MVVSHQDFACSSLGACFEAFIFLYPMASDQENPSIRLKACAIKVEPWFRILEHSYNRFTLCSQELLKLHCLVVYSLSLAVQTNRTFSIHKGVIALIDLSSPCPSTVEAVYLG